MHPIRTALVGVASLVVTAGGMGTASSADPSPAVDTARDAMQVGSFSPVGALQSGRTAHTATALPDGRVLVIGGIGGGEGQARPLATAELWDPGARSFRPAGVLHHARAWHSATLLGDGRVLVIGGAEGYAPAEVWAPTTGSFEESATSVAERAGHTATLLPDGRVLVAGGYGGQGMIAEAQLWDPQTAVLSPAGALQEVRSHHTATLLPDGRVLLVGGDSDLVFRDSAELWDPATESFSLTGSLTDARWWHTAAPTPDGGVLVMGGLGWDEGPLALASTERWAPATGVFEPWVPLAEARAWHASAPLSSGLVLVVGGADLAGGEDRALAALDRAELLDLDEGEVEPAGQLQEARAGHTVTLSVDGCVLVAGGAREPMQVGGILTSAELWCPPGCQPGHSRQGRRALIPTDPTVVGDAGGCRRSG